MVKIKKIFLGLFIIYFAFVFKVSDLKAACSVSVSAPKNVVAGNTFKVTATVSSDVGSWYYVLSYDASKVRLISGTPKVVGVIGDSKTNTYTFKAISSGTATFKATNVSLASNSTNAQCSSYAGSSKTTIKTQAEIEASYSRNNNLSQLSVEGAELSPAFNSDVTEYSATLPVDTTKANIVAAAQDSTATISGSGQIDVVDGLNKIEVVVTAQHGEKKTYTINLTVQELDPIEVKVDNEKYTIVRKKGQIENIPVTFIEDKITIENQEVVAYKSKTAKLTLLALKDSKGDIKLFIYNSANKKFSLFNAANSSANLVILNQAGKKVPKDFIKDNIKINDNNVTAYKYRYDKDNNYYLVYAKNLETANESFYLYDKKEGTYQRYYDNLLDTKDLHIKYLLYISICLITLFILILLIKLLVKMFLSKENKINKYQKKIDKLKKDTKSNLYEEDRVSIEKIDKDDYVTPKKSRKERLNELKEAKKKLDQNKNKYRRISLEEDDFD